MKEKERHKAYMAMIGGAEGHVRIQEHLIIGASVVDNWTVEEWTGGEWKILKRVFSHEEAKRYIRRVSH